MYSVIGGNIPPGSSTYRNLLSSLNHQGQLLQHSVRTIIARLHALHLHRPSFVGDYIFPLAILQLRLFSKVLKPADSAKGGLEASVRGDDGCQHRAERYNGDKARADVACVGAQLSRQHDENDDHDGHEHVHS